MRRSTCGLNSAPDDNAARSSGKNAAIGFMAILWTCRRRNAGKCGLLFARVVVRELAAVEGVGERRGIFGQHAGAPLSVLVDQTAIVVGPAVLQVGALQRIRHHVEEK